MPFGYELFSIRPGKVLRQSKVPLSFVRTVRSFRLSTGLEMAREISQRRVQLKLSGIGRVNSINHGKFGVIWHLPAKRRDFVSSASENETILEIGPYSNPFFTGPNVKYFDILNAEEIRADAQKHGRPVDNSPKEIHYIQRQVKLCDIKERFDIVYSGHMIEHTLDLIGHFNEVAEILDNGGKYYLTIPDKRYCFDHFKNVSTVGHVIDAHETGRSDYSLGHWIDGSLRVTHNSPKGHWNNEHGEWLTETAVSRARHAIAEYKRGYRKPMMPHSWFFTPDSFAEIMFFCHELGYTPLKLTDVHQTMEGAQEFHAILTKQA